MESALAQLDLDTDCGWEVFASSLFARVHSTLFGELPQPAPRMTALQPCIGKSAAGASLSTSFRHPSPSRHQAAKGAVASSSSSRTPPVGRPTFATSTSSGAFHWLVQTDIGNPSDGLSSLYRESGTPSRLIPTPRTV